ncbi:hypothetical protein CAEBREN_28905 [Caenorhabditis brenneri]|uniref:Uncharacterized protein n=1 Tax=Caenorhabditis brenneri TaxID=135651 RepID=G0PBV1_CAEBE|nr:hypothetical protein CAEBREN_28905 [Caenorhabditis brenneri]
MIFVNILEYVQEKKL